MDNGPQGIGITIPISGVIYRDFYFAWRALIYWYVLSQVTGLILQKIAAWCEHHKNDPHTDDDEDDEGSRKRTDDIVEWDQVFMQVDHETLFDIIWVSSFSSASTGTHTIQAADFLDIRPLIDLGCKTIANMVKGKSPQEIRRIFKISTESNTDEEEIRRKNGRSYMSTG